VWPDVSTCGRQRQVGGRRAIASIGTRVRGVIAARSSDDQRESEQAEQVSRLHYLTPFFGRASLTHQNGNST
jgi:hypothetical protein